ncbi:hypothetical protein HD554DRAFT_2038877 [Boletus coccyginus]|nr:hypothetical protein HD554DRAFT_2038877 [Boletus coccyginus]
MDILLLLRHLFHSYTSDTYFFSIPSQLGGLNFLISNWHIQFLKKPLLFTHQHDELKHQKEVEQAQHLKQAIEHIIAFNFLQDDVKPTSVNFQGFSFLYFKLMKAALVKLELAHTNEELLPPVHYFNSELDYWIRMKVDSTIIIISPEQQLFFKAVNIKSFPSFDHLYGHTAVSLQDVPNFYTMLTQEHQQF